MPIYEYKCLNCGNQLEVMQKISDEPLRECPRCQGKLEKQWSLSGFQFKGTGWYVSDYGNKVDAESRKAENASHNAAAESGGAEAKTESKGEKSASEKNTSTGDVAKTSSSGESTAGASGASKPESKSPESLPTAKTD